MLTCSFKLCATVSSAKSFNYVIIVSLKPLLLILRSKHGSICCSSKEDNRGLAKSQRGIYGKIMNASAAACHRGGWDNGDLMHAAALCLLGSMYIWIPDSYAGSLETCAILLVPS